MPTLLDGCPLVPTGDVAAAAYARVLLASLGADVGCDETPSGASFTDHVRGAGLALRVLSPDPDRPIDVDGPTLLGARTALTGQRPSDTVSASGHCRLVRALDGHVAVNLSRPHDLDVLEAWLLRPCADDPWAAVVETLAVTPATEAVERAQLVGTAAAAAVTPEDARRDEQARSRGQHERMSPVRFLPAGRTRRRRREPLVVDLSALWAGPLCAQLLRQAGGRVVKVESRSRPDGARAGSPAFFALLNEGKEHATVDLGTEAGRRDLLAHVEAADLVIESSRPRAMAQLGIDPFDVVAASGGVWVSITGYGRTGPWSNRVAFGDDAAVAAGLARVAADADGRPRFYGDATADPVSGLMAAVAVLAAWRSGASGVIDVAMREVVNHLLLGIERLTPSCC